MLQRRGLGILIPILLTSIRVLEDIQALGVGAHDRVLDAVMNHLDEVTGTVGPAVQPALFFWRERARSTKGPFDVTRTWGNRCPDRGEIVDLCVLATDHQAVAAFQSPHPAGGPAVDEVQALLGASLGVPDVVAVVGVATIDDGVTFFQQGTDLADHDVGDLPGRNHDPDVARPVELGDELFQTVRSDGAIGHQFGDRCRVGVIDDGAVSVLHDSADDVRPHPPETDHSQLHWLVGGHVYSSRSFVCEWQVQQTGRGPR